MIDSGEINKHIKVPNVFGKEMLERRRIRKPSTMDDVPLTTNRSIDHMDLKTNKMIQTTLKRTFQNRTKILQSQKQHHHLTTNPTMMMIAAMSVIVQVATLK
jgi:hypothetical protein